ncbi:MAG: threonine-phosphate decarboxylase [Geobacter sp.]|nr:threonine-phosphate decarboxylase [Geobacter sp.]
MNHNSNHGGNIFAMARNLGLRPEDILDFSASINPLGPPPTALEAIRSVCDNLVHYPDSDATELRHALARYHGIAPENICAANGSTELIYLLPRLARGRRALVVAPPFSEYARALVREGWEFDYFLLSSKEDFVLSASRLELELRKGYDLLFLCNPGNPTGRLLPISEIKEIVACCSETGTFLALDEAFIDFREEESAKHFICSAGNGIVLRSMTKFFAIPGLRLGYAIGSQEIIADLAAMREPWSVNTLAQAAGVAALADSDYTVRTRQYVARERECLAAGLLEIPGLKPYQSDANYLLIEILAGPDATQLQSQLLEDHILVRDCSNFHGLNDRFFRVAVRTTEENGRLLQALRRIYA